MNTKQITITVLPDGDITPFDHTIVTPAEAELRAMKKRYRAELGK